MEHVWQTVGVIVALGVGVFISVWELMWPCGWAGKPMQWVARRSLKAIESSAYLRASATANRWWPGKTSYLEWMQLVAQNPCKAYYEHARWMVVFAHVSGTVMLFFMVVILGAWFGR